jgi:hypothetical protein
MSKLDGLKYRSLKHTFDEAIENLLKIGEDEKEDLLFREDARKLARQLIEFSGGSTTAGKRMGRTALAAQRNKHKLRYKLVEQMRAKQPNLSLTSAFEAVGARLVSADKPEGITGGAVSKSYYKGKKQLRSQ